MYEASTESAESEVFMHMHVFTASVAMTLFFFLQLSQS